MMVAELAKEETLRVIRKEAGKVGREDPGMKMLARC